MKPVLEIQGVSKKFRISHEARPYLSLRESLAGIFSRHRESREDFWALDNINVSVDAGECLGIVGRNGAGKSTLLKILSRITPPTKGRVIGRGRVASLLEVGTGFHPELTGRENVYLNGSILGMKRREIDKQFDAIIDFAGTEKFLDTQLKYYSSGMQLRLAFAVAAFLEPEILLIDEVLAVGDAEFQRKCLGKMEDVTSGGRTVLFVSHNLAAVTRLCSRAILLAGGRLTSMGAPESIIQQYVDSIGDEAQGVSGFFESNKGVIKRVELMCDGMTSGTLYMGCRLEVRVHFVSEVALEAPVLGIIIKDNQQSPLVGINNNHYSRSPDQRPVFNGYLAMSIPYLPLFEGNYSLDVHLGNGFRDLEVLRDCLRFTVAPTATSDAGQLPDKQLNRIYIRDVSWSVHSNE